MPALATAHVLLCSSSLNFSSLSTSHIFSREHEWLCHQLNTMYVLFLKPRLEVRAPLTGSWRRETSSGQPGINQGLEGTQGRWGWGAWEVREAEERPGWVSGKAASGSAAAWEQHHPDSWALGGAISPLCHKEPGRVWHAASPLGVCAQQGSSLHLHIPLASPAGWPATRFYLVAGRDMLWELIGGRQVGLRASLTRALRSTQGFHCPEDVST